MRFVDISLLIISSTLGIVLAIYIARNRRAPGSPALSLLILGASLWSVGYAFEILASSLAVKLFWEKFEFFGIVVIPLAWFTFVAQYLGCPAWMKRLLNQRFLLGLIPALTLVLVWTNDWHSLVWRQVTLAAVGPLITLEFVRGPWFWVFMVYSYILLLLGSIKLITSLFTVIRLQRWQILLTLLAIALPWMGNIVYMSGLGQEHTLDWIAFLFLFSGVLFSLSLFRFQLVNILPIAQETIFSGLSDSVFILDVNNSISDMNQSAKELLDDSKKRSIGKLISQVIPQIEPHLKQANGLAKYSSDISLRDGTDQQFYDVHISQLIDGSSNLVGRLVVFHQITQYKHDQVELERARAQLEMVVSERTIELKQAVDNLQQELEMRTLAEKRFKDVVESAPDAMFLLDQSGKILLINGKAERMFGYPREELIGRNIIDSLIPSEYRSRQRTFFTQFLQDSTPNQNSFGMDLYARRKDGRLFPMEADFSRLDISNGFWVAINIHDISERKQAEVALRESEQTYRALFENAGDAIFLTDMEGRIIKANQKAADLLGFSQQELLSLSIFDVTALDDRLMVKRFREKLLNGEQVPNFIRRYVKHSGEIMPTENNLVLVRDALGSPKFFQNIARDITERLHAERAQAQLLDEIKQSNEQMRSLALQLQEVQESERKELAVELHDRVGQNLTGLNLNLKILQNQLQSDHQPELQKRLDDSLQMVEETTHKIRDVMADLNPPVLDEYGLSAAVKWFGGEFASKTGISMHVSADKFEPRLPSSVEKILFRLVQESLNNVAKHAQASHVTISLKSSKDSVSLMIKDNGLGFDPLAVREPTLQPHWGLLSMQQRASSIGATLVIDSTPGAGTRVYVRLRRNQHAD